MIPYIKGKKVLFVTTKNLDYIRNAQEINIIIQNASSCTIIGSCHKSYAKRLICVYTKLIFLNANKFDTVFIGFSPQLILPIFAHKFRKLYIIEDFFISMYDTLCCDRKIFKPQGLIGKLLHRIDKATLKKSNFVICDTNTHGDYFSKEFQIDREKIHTLYLKADTAVYHPMDIPKPAKYKDRFIVCYFGSMLPLQGIDIILNAFKLLQDTSKIKLICIGPVKTKINLDNVEYIDWLSQSKLAKYIAMSDLCLAGHFNSDIAKAMRTIPGKAYIYMAMEKPMILGDTPANHELFNPSQRITFVEPGNPMKLANAILDHFVRYEEAKLQS